MPCRNVLFSVLLLLFFTSLTIGVLQNDSSVESYDIDELAGKTGRELACLQPSSTSAGSSEASSRRWQKDGRDIVPSPDDWVIVNQDTMQQESRLKITPDGLLFRALKLEDSGVYDCIMTLSTDQLVLSRYRLAVRDVPNPPGIPTQQHVSSRNITLSWRASTPMNSPILHYLVLVEPQVGKFDGFSLEPASSGSAEEERKQRRIRTPDNTTTFTVTNLFPFTIYTFQLIAVSSVGHSRPSPLSPPMQTLTEPPSAAPVLIMANSTSSSSIRLQWLPPNEGDLHGALKGFRLCFRRAGSEQTDEIILDNPQAQTYEIRKLSPGRRYYISVQAFNDDGYSPAHTEVVSTLESEPSAPRNLLIKGVTNTTVSLAWRSPSHFNGVILGYKIHYTHPAGFTDTKVLSWYTPPSNEEEEGAGEGKGAGGGEWVTYVLRDLQPFTTYHVRLTAFTKKGDGPYSASTLNVLTDVGQPGSPQILNVTRVAENAVLVEWTAPREVFRQLDVYYIQYSQTSPKGDLLRTQQLQHTPTVFGDVTKTRALKETTSSRVEVEQAVITNLTSQDVYHIAVSAGTRSIVSSGKVFRGEPSLTFSFNMQSDGALSRKIPSTSHFADMEMIIILLLLFFLGVSAVLCALFCALRKRFILGRYTYLAPNSPKCEEKEKGLMHSPTQENTDLTASTLPLHVKKLYADGQIGLSKEFENLATLLQNGDFLPSLKEAQRTENRTKNRYVNVLAYDHTRVKLKHLWHSEQKTDTEGSEGGEGTEGGEDCGCSPRTATSKAPLFDYINANFVDSIDSPNAYIVMQAPLPNTLVDFWSVVYDYKVRVIIMLTNLEENGRKKCEKYWPSLEEGEKWYGPYAVTPTSQHMTAFYTVRNFTVTLKKEKKREGDLSEVEEVRHVVQYLYSDWPDHGRPDVVVPLLRFIMKSSRLFEEGGEGGGEGGGGMPIVHCSAGVGRSGCYVALHSLMLQLDRSGRLDVFQYLLAARKQRMALCQNESQYALIYDALLEYVQSDQTEVYIATMDEYVESLLKEDGRGVRRQHALLTRMGVAEGVAEGVTEGVTEYAMEPYNRTKNRSVQRSSIQSGSVQSSSVQFSWVQFLPTDEGRVVVGMKAGVPGSDYINASFLPSYLHSKQFIITQYPLPDTVLTFWQMIWEHRVENVVLLEATRLVKEPEDALSTGLYDPFWPSSTRPHISDTFQVTLKDTLDTPPTPLVTNHSYTLTECTLTPLNQEDDKNPLVCRIIQTSTDVTRTLRSDVTAVSEVFGVLEGVGRGTVVVMDECGGAVAALFCGLISVRQQGMAEGSVDVYQTARLYNHARPGVFCSLDTYVEFYEASRGICRQIAECIPVEEFCFAGSGLRPSSSLHVLNASKRLSAILEQEEAA